MWLFVDSRDSCEKRSHPQLRSTFLAIVVLLIPCVESIAQTYVLSGRVYVGHVGDESRPLEGARVELYASNDVHVLGELFSTTHTNEQGWYGLQVPLSMEFFTIVQQRLEGYTSVGATTVDGTVKQNNRIQYAYPLDNKTLTGNKFWIQSQEQGLPDLMVEDCWSQGTSVCYRLRNIGSESVTNDFTVALKKNDESIAQHSVDRDLEPGADWVGCFEDVLFCDGPAEYITIIADQGNQVHEQNEANNFLEIWLTCESESVELAIISGPDIEHLTPHTVAVNWETNMDSFGLARFSQTAGPYPHEVQDPALSRSHRMVLSDLEPVAVYRLVVECSDQAGHRVKSPTLTFETWPLPDNEDPSVSLYEPNNHDGVVVLMASAFDNTGVDRVVFTMDGARIFTDYSPPYEAPVDTKSYVNGNHTIGVEAFDPSGRQSIDQRGFDINNLADASAPTVTITSHQAGDQVSGEITVRAEVTDDKGLWKAEFYVDGNSVQYEVFGGMTPPKTAKVQFKLDTRQVSKDKTNDQHTIAVRAYDTDYKQGTDAVALYITNVTPTPQAPWLKVTAHTAVRNQNRFAISLTVKNQGNVTARNVRIYNGLEGFHAISDNTGNTQFVSHFNPKAKFGNCEIQPQPIPAGAQRTYTYNAVPVLLNPAGISPKIGNVITLEYDSPTTTGRFYFRSNPLAVSQVTTSSTTESVNQAYANANKTADYLLVTNPYKLYAVCNPTYYQAPSQKTTDTDLVLSKMAELAFYKQGVLGYTYVNSNIDLDALIDAGGAWSSQLAGGWASNGYLLLVGETEIVCSWGKIFTYNSDPPQKWQFVSDYRYASTNSVDYHPELNIGRIIGNSASDLTKVLQNSINAYLQVSGYGFDRSHTLLASGHPGSGYKYCDFKTWVNDASKIIAQKAPASPNVHKKIDQPNATQLFNAMPNQDIIYLAGHGNVNDWTGITVNNVKPQTNLFGSACPFIFAVSCKTGRYEKGFCLGEAFLQEGAGVYLGPTDSAGWGYCSNAFFQRWEMGEAVGRADKQTKQSLGNDLKGKLWKATYHVFGDPKFGQSASLSSSSALSLFAESPVQPEGPTEVDVAVPDYEVTRIEGVDYVTFPDGLLLSCPPLPEVPYIKVSYQYPRATQIQDVALTQVSEPVMLHDLYLPLATMALPGQDIPDAPGPVEMPVWWPEKHYDWEVFKDGQSTTLVIGVYAFQYHREMQEALFHQHYSFAVDYTHSDVQITRLDTDKTAYEPGEPVHVNFELTNQGEPVDALVEAVVKEDTSGDIVGGLVLRTLRDFAGKASYACAWDNADMPPGTYTIVAELSTLDGILLEQETQTIDLGICAGQVTDLTVDPQQAQPGESIRISASFANTGTVNLSGSLIVRVSDFNDIIVDETMYEFTDLLPTETALSENTWVVPASDLYTVSCYALYQGNATDPLLVDIDACNDEACRNRPTQPPLEPAEIWIQE